MRLHQHEDFGPIVVATTEWLQRESNPIVSCPVS